MINLSRGGVDELATLLLMKKKSKSKYTPLLYLRGTGPQFINTGVPTDSAYGYELKFRLVTFANSEFFGGGTAYGNGLGVCTHGGGSLGLVVGSEVTTFVPNYTDDYIVKVDNYQIFVNGEYKGTGSRSTATNPLYVFQKNPHGSSCGYRVYYCNIYDESGNPVRLYTPALCKAGRRYVDGNTLVKVKAEVDTPGLYDNVTKTLFVNKGSGSFLYELK